MGYKDEEWLREQYQDKTQAEIADDCGVSRTTITRWMDKLGIESDGPGCAQVDGKHKDEEWLREKYVQEQRSTNDIAEECGVGKTTVIYWLDKHGIERRNQREAIHLSWKGDEERREAQAEWMREISEPWWGADEETQERVRERLSEWWTENNPMEGRTKEDNPAWKGGAPKYYGPNWDEQRARALDRDNHECQRCGSANNLVVHHHAPIRIWRNDSDKDIEDANQLWNLVTLCEECHGAIEGKRLSF